MTELPLRLGRRPLLSLASPSHGVALVSLPALGPLRRDGRLLDELAAAIGVLVGELPPDGSDRRLVSRVLTGNVRLLLGMIQANRPWRLAVRLSGSAIGALTTAAYALLASDVWRIWPPQRPARDTLTDSWPGRASAVSRNGLVIKADRPADLGSTAVTTFVHVTGIVTNAASFMGRPSLRAAVSSLGSSIRGQRDFEGLVGIGGSESGCAHVPPQMFPPGDTMSDEAHTNGSGPPEQPSTRGEKDAPAADPQTLEDRDQTFSDGDQTLSDRDQSLSDLEQDASDEDQAAADREQGGDGESASHARTAALRASTAKERRTVGDQRDDIGLHRDQEAKARDELAEQRDAESEILAQRALELDGSDGVADKHTLRVQEMRGRAEEARRRAALDRDRATKDRKLAAKDRELAARDREQAGEDRDRAGSDELTGARRRGVGVEELQREIDRSGRTGENVVGVYVDVDGLKAVNDKHGHTAGDKLLCEVAERLRASMRPYDLVIRLGGDEFFCVLPGVPAELARTRFESMHNESSCSLSSASISIGLTELQAGDGANEMIDRADHELLERRAAGRTG